MEQVAEFIELLFAGAWTERDNQVHLAFEKAQGEIAVLKAACVWVYLAPLHIQQLQQRGVTIAADRKTPGGHRVF